MALVWTKLGVLWSLLVLIAVVGAQSDISAPRDLSVSILSNSGGIVELTWSDTDNEISDAGSTYLVVYRKIYPEQSPLHYMETTSQVATLYGLDPNSQYEFRVRKTGPHSSPVYAHIDAPYVYVGCYMRPNPTLNEGDELYRPIKGRITVKERTSGDGMEIDINLTGFDANSTHAFHCHSYGMIDNVRGCYAIGSHYNPLNKLHGDVVDVERHIGDFGNIRSDEYGDVRMVIQDDVASLVGPHSLVGRAFDVHAKPDDLGRGGNAKSLRSGNAGFRIACCTIGYIEEP